MRFLILVIAIVFSQFSFADEIELDIRIDVKDELGEYLVSPSKRTTAFLYSAVVRKVVRGEYNERRIKFLSFENDQVVVKHSRHTDLFAKRTRVVLDKLKNQIQIEDEVIQYVRISNSR